jgi:protoheme IX farnesyltransferase
MIGWAVATGGVSVESVLMFLLIFMWTPPHFWALALFMKEDYHTAGVPMLTVTHGRRETRRQILIYTVLLVPVGIWAALTSIGGPFTLAVSVVLNAIFLKGAWDIYARSEEQAEGDKYMVEKKVFKFSLAYLFLHFTAFLIEAVLKTYGLGGW